MVLGMPRYDKEEIRPDLVSILLMNQVIQVLPRGS